MIIHLRLLKYFFIAVLISGSFIPAFAQSLAPLESLKKYGGNKADIISCWVQTPDGGFIIGGSSASPKSEQKSDSSRGGLDYWIIKLDKKGNKEWDKTYGAQNHDYLKAIVRGKDGNYLLAGYTYSQKSGEKSKESMNDDFWIIKISPKGKKLWDKTIGGSSADRLTDAIATSDGGFLLGGNSASPISGYKSEGVRSITDNPYLIDWDYWVIKINSEGTKEWDKTLGGGAEYDYSPQKDELVSLVETEDKGFLIGGFSNSSIGFDKTEENQSYSNHHDYINNDYWIVKLNSHGKKEWDKVYGGGNGEILFKIIKTPDHNYILVGIADSKISGNKTQASDVDKDYYTNLSYCALHAYMVKIDGKGKILRQKAYNPENKLVATVIATPGLSGYYLGTKTLADTTKINYLTKIDWVFDKELWVETVPQVVQGDWGFLELSKKGDLYIGITSTFTFDPQDYLLYKYNPNELKDIIEIIEIAKGDLEIYPNPFSDYLNISLPTDWKEVTTIILYDLFGKEYFHKAGNQRQLSFDLSHLQLRPGFYMLKVQSGSENKIVRLYKK